MHEKKTPRLQPAADAAKQLGVIPHMLEHLDRNDAIELSSAVEVVHVAGNGDYIFEPALEGLF